MKRVQMMLGMAVMLLGSASVWAQQGFQAVVKDVTLVQRKSTRFVDINYTLENQEAIITVTLETNGVPVEGHLMSTLSGDVSTVIQPGTHSIKWDAGSDWPEQIIKDARAHVKAWAIDAPPPYCVVDISGKAQGSVAYPIRYYPNQGSVPMGVTNDLYKTTHILMRRIPATGGGGFKMGSPEIEVGGQEYDKVDYKKAIEVWHDVVLTKSFYIGVYEITQSQWGLVMNGYSAQRPSAWHLAGFSATRPVERISMNHLRENTLWSFAPDVNWPVNRNVYPDSFIGRMRARTGNEGFDLPMEAQWEYACRAGTTGALNDGTMNLVENHVSTNALNRIARSQLNSRIGEVKGGSEGTYDTNYGTAKVGSYEPNAWGLYDMHGNVAEMCVDRYQTSLGRDRAVDPKGPIAKEISEKPFVIRGGSFKTKISACRSASRRLKNRGWQYDDVGFRLALNFQ